MKTITLAAAAALVLAGCGSGGGGGHSDAYNKGYKWATVTANDDISVGAYAGFNGIDATCHYYATQQALGLNPQEWVQGCMDGLPKTLEPSKKPKK